MQTSFDLRLARHGAIVLLLGLLFGFVITKFHNRAVGDAAHSVGLIGGFGMIGLSAIWPRLPLSRFWSTAGAWSTAVCMYANWLGCVFLAVGSGPAAPGAPLIGASLPWNRAAGVVLFAAIWLSLLSTLIVLIGLFRRTAPGVRTSPGIQSSAPAPDYIP